MTAFVQNKTIRLGYRRARSHDIIDIPDCMILDPALQDKAQSLRPYLVNILSDSRPATIFMQQDSRGALDVLITGPVGTRKNPDVHVRQDIATMVHECGLARVSWRLQDRDEPEIIVQQHPVIKESNDIKVELPPGAFLQPGRDGERALIDAITKPLAGKQDLKIADLFSGCGTFSAPLLSYGRVDAYEIDAPSVKALSNAARTQDKLNVYKRNLFKDTLTAKELSGYDAIIIDPPRAGAKTQMTDIAGSDIPLVISVSCNPATFVRDAQTLIDGGYECKSVQVIDQFIWSAHSEMVGIFKR